VSVRGIGSVAYGGSGLLPPLLFNSTIFRPSPQKKPPLQCGQLVAVMVRLESAYTEAILLESISQSVVSS